MFVASGEFGKDGMYKTMLDSFRKLDLFAEIGASPDTTLEITTWVNQRYGETRLLVGDTDVGDTVPQMWCTGGVQQRPVRIKIFIVAGRPGGAVLELLAHEWCLHGAKNWRFVQAMRVASSPEEVADRYREIVGTATSAIDLAEHREMAEGRHEFFLATLRRLRDLEPGRAAELLEGWKEDLDEYKHSARPGMLATATWDPPAPAGGELPADDTSAPGGADPDLEDFLNG